MASPLNPAQLEAVEHAQGPLLVLAGAGSGKTRVICQRIARLIEKGTRPESILAVSFTNKAAREMQERVERMASPSAARAVWMSTFHSFGVRFLKEETKAMGYGERFVIFDQGDCLGIVRDILRRRRVGDRRLDAMAILTRISLWKNKFLSPEVIPESDFEYDAIAREVYPIYEEQLVQMRAVDFDDLVVRPARLLKENEALREKWQMRFRHLLVDEFQDTNVSQLELVRLLTNRLRNVCVVGDDDQSIYGWRGAEVGNIIDFERHFPGAKVVKLEQNYRSKSQILDVANSVILKSKKEHHHKTLRAARGEGQRVQVCLLHDGVEEAQFLAKEIRRRVRDGGRRYGDYAVLYRSNTLARAVEEELRVEGVPYRLLGGTQFFDRKEVKDALSYLRVVLYPYDELALRRVINHPPRGIGAKTVERLTRYAEAHETPLGVAFKKLPTMDDVPNLARQGARRLQAALEDSRSRLKGGERLVTLCQKLVSDVGLERDIRSEGGIVAKRKWDNMEFLFNSLRRYEKSQGSDANLAEFLNRTMLRVEQEEEAASNRVTLSTLHASKGLEFPCVYLIGCVEGYLPHRRTTEPKLTEAAPSDVEEERRLFYVGVTRARDELYLTRARKRRERGKEAPLAPSRFLEGLPEHAVEHLEPEVEPTMDKDELAQAASDILAMLSGG